MKKLKITIINGDIELIGINLRRFKVTLKDVESLERAGYTIEIGEL